MLDFIINIDRTILYWIQDTLQCTFCDKFFVIATYFGEKGIFWIATAILLAAFPKTRKIGITVMWAIGISFLMSQIVIKGLVGRIRPFEYFNYDTALMLIKIPLDSSFPSSHSCVSFAAATAIILHNRKFGIPAVIIAILVAASRMYLFVHYPSDVLVGTLLGITVAVLAFIIIDRIIKKSEMKKQQKEALSE